jgi:hypothetical protein
MHPQRAVRKCAVVAPGAVSVMPHEAVSGMSWSATSSASARIRAHSASGSAAAA